MVRMVPPDQRVVVAGWLVAAAVAAPAPVADSGLADAAGLLGPACEAALAPSMAAARKTSEAIRFMRTPAQ
jgi:hypothetical protein